MSHKTRNYCKQSREGEPLPYDGNKESLVGDGALDIPKMNASREQKNGRPLTMKITNDL